MYESYPDLLLLTSYNIRSIKVDYEFPLKCNITQVIEIVFFLSLTHFLI